VAATRGTSLTWSGANYWCWPRVNWSC
jgi:hypothetical protein